MAADDTTSAADDPYAGDDGRIGALFADEVGADVAGLLGAADMWERPSEGLLDGIVTTISTESAVGGGQQAIGEGDASGHAEVAPRDGAVSDGAGPRPAEVVSLTRWRQVRAGLIGAAAAIIVLAGAVVLFSTTGGQPAETAFTAEMVPTGLVPDVGGEVEVIPVQSGLRIELDAPSLPRRDGGSFYEGWLRLDDDRLVPIGTFHEGGDVTLWAGIELERVMLMTITLESAVAGSSPEQASSGDVVLKVDFPTEES